MRRKEIERKIEKKTGYPVARQKMKFHDLNLMCSEHKATNDKFRENYERIRWDR